MNSPVLLLIILMTQHDPSQSEIIFFYILNFLKFRWNNFYSLPLWSDVRMQRIVRKVARNFENCTMTAWPISDNENDTIINNPYKCESVAQLLTYVISAIFRKCDSSSSKICSRLWGHYRITNIEYEFWEFYKIHRSIWRNGM